MFGFGGQPVPPSLRPHFPTDYSSSPVPRETTSNLQSSSSKTDGLCTRDSKSPEPLMSPISISKQPLHGELLHNSNDNELVDSEDSSNEEANDISLPISTNISRQTTHPITSKDSMDEIEKYNCDGPNPDKGKEAIAELSSLLPSSSENASKMSSESIAT